MAQNVGHVLEISSLVFAHLTSVHKRPKNVRKWSKLGLNEVLGHFLEIASLVNAIYADL